MKRDIKRRKILLEDVKYMCQLVHANNYDTKEYTYKQVREMFDVIVMGMSEDDYIRRYKTIENL